jgi:hypothetical protein
MENLDQSAAMPVDRPRRGWLGRNWMWFVPTTLLVLVLACGGCCVVIVGAVFGVLKSSEPYKMALERVQNDPKVIEALGQPIEAGWTVSGEVIPQIGPASGNARLDFDVSGPKGKAHVHSEARCVFVKWGLTKVEVTTPDNKRIVLDVSGDNDDGGDAAPFQRGT